ncbi:MAG: ABC transporter permease [Lachnospiraceae bacterium]
MLENIRISFQGIWSHKMRSFLTMLGIIIGIASIIAIVSTIKGTSEQIKDNLIGSGNNTIKISLYDGDYEYDMDMGMSSQNLPQLTEEQKEELLALEHVKDATFFHFRSYANNIYHNNTTLSGGKALGIDDHYLSASGYQIQLGRSFVQQDYDNYRKVVLLDESAASTLFPDSSPVGEVIELGSEPFTVVGVVEPVSSFQPTINSISDYELLYMQDSVGTVYIPKSTWPVVYKFDEPENVIVRADSTDSMSSVGKASADLLNEYTDAGSTVKYKATDLLEKAKSLQELSRSTSGQLLWIASISLLVGGIGVMNIMLVSVTERTSEIGLKKAIGARKHKIMIQFLTEAAVLTSVGGVIGIITGLILAQVVARISETPTAVSMPAIVLSVVFSMVIGIVFGLLPSYKAANLNPIEALRREN